MTRQQDQTTLDVDKNQIKKNKIEQHLINEKLCLPGSFQSRSQNFRKPDKNDDKEGLDQRVDEKQQGFICHHRRLSIEIKPKRHLLGKTRIRVESQYPARSDKNTVENEEYTDGFVLHQKKSDV